MALAASLLLLGLFYFYFENSLQARNNPNQQLQIAPAGELLLKRSRNGHYFFPGAINGQPVTFLLDTGATLVSVPAHMANELGLRAGARQQSVTANGTVTTGPPGWVRWRAGRSICAACRPASTPAWGAIRCCWE